MAQAAARFEDPIGHMSVWGRLARVALNVGTSLLEGVAVAALITVAVGGSIATMGCGAIIVGGLVAGFIGGATGYTDWKRKKIDDLVSHFDSPTITGKIISGSSNVKINNIAAARAEIDVAQCSKHSQPPQMVAQGSDSIFINTFPAARKDDKIACGGAIAAGSPNVFFGGGTTTVCEIAEDRDWWETPLEIGIGLLMMRGGAWARLGCLGVGLLAGMVGDKLGRGFRSLIGYPVNPATGGKILDGGTETDFVLPGPLPIEWSRFYSSHDHRDDGMFGQGWSVPYNIELQITRDEEGRESICYIDFQGRKIDFPALAPGQSNYAAVAGVILGRTEGGHYQIQTLDQQYYLFGAPAAGVPLQTLKLKRIQDIHGNWIALRHDAARRLIALADSIGRLIDIDYSGDSLRADAVRLTQAAEGEQTGTLVRYRHDQAGQLAEVIDRAGNPVRRFAYRDRLMTEHGDAKGFTCHYEWQAAGAGNGPEGDRRVVRHWTNDGESYRIDYALAPEGGSTTATDQLGRVQSWSWDAHYNLTGYRNALGHAWQLEWNEDRKLTRATGPSGNTLQYDYNDLGLIVAETDPLGRRTTTLWHERWAAPLKIVQPDGGTWRYAYDDRANLIRVTDPAQHDTEYAYEPRGLPILVTDAKGGRKRLAWNSRAQLIAYTDCSGKTTRHEYDGRNNLARSIDALGQATEYAYDPAGRLTSLNFPDGSSRHYRYDPAGQLTAAIDPLNRVTGFQYNLRGHLVRRDDAAGRHIKCSYDKAHRLSMLVNENNQPYRFRYDDADRMVEETRLDGTRQQIEYDLLGLASAVTDLPGDDDVVEGHQPVQPIRIELQRDALGRLIEKRTPDARYQYSYDLMDRLLQAEKMTADGQPLHSNRFGYGKLGELLKEESIDAVADSRSELQYAYDPLGNRIATMLPDGRTLNHLYYGSGHLHQINLDGALIADFERDDLHREVLRTQGRLTSRYAYDPLGRKTAVWTQPAILNPGAWHPGSEWEKKFSKPDAGDVLLKQYQYDPVGELRNAKHKLNGNTEYRYDQTGRIESTNSSIRQLSEFFYFDPAGNRLTPEEKHEGWGQIRNNRVKVIEDKRYDYDGFGRMIRKRIGAHTVQHFKYDSEHRLITAAVIRSNTKDGKPLHQLFHYRYDALGRRIAKQDAFGETAFVWEGMRLLQEQRGGKQATYVYEPHSYNPLARIDGAGPIQPHPAAKLALGGSANAKARSIPPTNPGWDDAFRAVAGWNEKAPAANDAAKENAPAVAEGEPKDTAQIYYFHTQANGLPEELSDNNGNLVWRAVYKTWGSTVAESWYEVDPNADVDSPLKVAERPAQFHQNLRFQGQYLDRETGLHYNTFRSYDPDIGRFTTPDPIGLAGGANLYRYAPNPVSWVDPWGWVAETTPGYNVYGLYAPGSSEPYYVGITDDLKRRAGEHRDSGRLPPDAEMRPIARDVTYGEARGIEQANIEHHGTKTGTIGSDLKNATTYDQRGNKVASFDHNNTTRDRGRQAYFENAYKNAKGKLTAC